MQQLFQFVGFYATKPNGEIIVWAVMNLSFAVVNAIGKKHKSGNVINSSHLVFFSILASRC